MRCRVTFKGTLTEPFLSSLVPSSVEMSGTATSLTFEVRDASEMWGVIGQMNNLGLGLIAVSTDEAGQLPGRNEAHPRGAAPGSAGSGRGPRPSRTNDGINEPW
jgi:hypothetical protein